MPHIQGHVVPGATPGAVTQLPAPPGAVQAPATGPNQTFIPGSATNPVNATPAGNVGLINDVFSQTLGRAPSAEVIAFYEQQFAQGLSPQEFAAQVANSQEALGRNTAPQTGLIGGEAALQQGLGASVASIEEGFGRGTGAVQGGTTQALDLIGQAQAPLQPFQQGGGQAFDVQLAQSGALGPEAQRAAFESFAASPGQQFLTQEAERALTRNAAALGGIGGGNVRRALQEQAIGLAQQDFGNQFNRLGQLSGQGLQAAGGIASLGGQGAGFAQQGGLAQGNLLAQAGTSAAQLFQQAGRDISEQRFQTGQDIARAVSGTTSALSNLAGQQGAGLADITGSGSVNIANLLSGFGQLDAAQQQQLATLLSNITVGEGTNLAELQAAIGEARAAGTTGAAEQARAGASQAAQLLL